MATSAGDSSILEEELTCPVCLELYRDPHLLPCGHNFCLPCLRRLRSRSDHGRLRCPECRQSHRSSANWQKNFKLANIADGFRRRGQSERAAQSRSNPSPRPAEVRCDYCPGDSSEDGKGPMAVKTCLKCEVSMCPKHVQPHLELPAFREHPLVEPLNDMRKRKCLEHDEMFRYYCMDERLFLCNACTIEGTHNGHCIKTLKNTMKDFKVGLTFQGPFTLLTSVHTENDIWYQYSKDWQPRSIPSLIKGRFHLVLFLLIQSQVDNVKYRFKRSLNCFELVHFQPLAELVKYTFNQIAFIV